MNAQHSKDSSIQELQEVVISFNKWETLLADVPNKMVSVKKPDIFFRNPQTSADLLAQSGSVYVQKS
ncbi:MAG TPA: hypothetical protein VIK74_05045 [Parasegetibacter sp.]